MKVVLYAGDKIADFLKITKKRKEKKEKEVIINKSNSDKEER